MSEVLGLKIEGGKKLNGSIAANSSKNGAVMLLCASLLNRGTTTIKNMPRIEEVKRIIEVLESIGVAISWSGRDVTLTPPQTLSLATLDTQAAKRTRSIIMFIGPLIHAFTSFSLPQSGGCKIGSRTVRPHFYALEKYGVTIKTKKDSYEIAHTNLKPQQTIVMYESGDTATGNAIMAAALIPGTTVLKYASANYQIQELCFFLEKLGVTFDGIGTTTLTIHGCERLAHNVTYTLSEDPTDVMFYLAAAIVTRSRITIQRCPIDFLELELLKLQKMGFAYTASKPYKAYNRNTTLVDITTTPSTLTASPEKIYGRPYPGLNIDNLPFFAVIATQAKGQTLIHDWTFEKRAIYYTELDKLGADTVLADPHRIFITGPTALRSTELICPPALRPATILLIAMLGARGTSILRNVYSINRGYEDLITKLNGMGAKITML